MLELKELKKYIKRHCSTYRKLADTMGIDRVSLSYKLNGFRLFNAKEIAWIHRYFNLTDEQVVSFFNL